LTQGCLATKTSTEFLSCWQPGAATGLHVRQPLNVGSWGGFTRVQIGMWERFYATLGLRGEHNRNYGHQRKVDWTPTNQLAYTIEYGDVTLKLLGAYGRATREPSPENRLENITHNTAYQPAQWVSRLANPLLRPEYSRGPEGGFEVYYGSHLSFTLNRYSQRITDLIELVNVDSLEVLRLSDNTTVYVQQSQFLNTASVRQHGWEATGSMNLFWFQVRGTYSWNDSRVLSVNPRQQRLSTQPGQTFRGLPSHMANLQFSFARGATSAVLSTNWVGSSVLLSSGDIVYMRNYYQRLHMYREWVGSYGLYGQFSKPGYAKSDFSMSHRINNSLSATVNITNVGNSTSNDVAAWAPSLGRQTLLGVSIVYPKR